MKRIDLHVHSNCSDGTVSPASLVSLAVSCGLSAFALTDHDNTDGIAEAEAAAGKHNIEIIPGIEFSTGYKNNDVHIVGLEMDWKNPGFQSQINEYRQERTRRNQRIIDQMADDGIDISYGQMAESFGEAVWTRAHFARYLTDHGYVNDMWEAFHSLLSPGCRYYVPRRKITPSQAVRLIRQYHGIPVLAHPLQYKLTDDERKELICNLKNDGLIGMEVYYSTHSREQEKYLLELAGKYSLLPDGGSDFHGSNKPDIALGSGKNNLAIPYEILENLRKKLQEEEHHEIS
ncbi:MAG: PHP domain-containing protein [Candidatus Choladocola sp.]|nr:PHP domain-containing protein [Candidatus Choladocola sp.]